MPECKSQEESMSEGDEEYVQSLGSQREHIVFKQLEEA